MSRYRYDVNGNVIERIAYTELPDFGRSSVICSPGPMHR